MQNTLADIQSKLEAVLGDHLVNRKVYLSTAANDNGSTAGKWTNAKLTLMSLTQIDGRGWGSVGSHYCAHDVGEATQKLPLFNYERYWLPYREWYWTRGLYGKFSWQDTIYAGAWRVGTDGSVGDYYCTYTSGSRPAFTLPSTLSVSDDGTVSVNTAPTITSSTANGSNLGTKTAGFNFQYTVNDVDGDTVTVKEYLDNVLKRTYTATLGQVNTFQAVTAANWQKILNGSHTLKVVANDGKADSTAYTVTFAKKVTKATVTLAAPLAADDAISVMVMNIVGTLPADAVMEVLVTNNAKDTTPVWEDATADVKNGANHVFTNKTAANGFAFNFKLSVERGASDTGGYISNIGGAFE